MTPSRFGVAPVYIARRSPETRRSVPGDALFRPVRAAGSGRADLAVRIGDERGPFPDALAPPAA